MRIKNLALLLAGSLALGAAMPLDVSAADAKIRPAVITQAVDGSSTSAAIQTAQGDVKPAVQTVGWRARAWRRGYYAPYYGYGYYGYGPYYTYRPYYGGYYYPYGTYYRGYYPYRAYYRPYWYW